MKLRITYSRSQDLCEDYDQQLVRRGILVRVEPAPDLALFSPLALELVSPVGRRTVNAQVIQTMPGVGIAVGFDDDEAAQIETLVSAARAAPEREGAGPKHEEVGDVDPPAADELAADGPAADEPARAVVDVHTRIRNATLHEKMQIALRGNREERGLIIRDPTAKMLHQYVLKNPKLQLDEVAAIAGLRTVAPEVLKYITGRREWAQRPDIAAALVRNPKTPVPLAIRLVPFLSVADLRQLAKASNVRPPIQREVRKKVLG